eukprot:762685-Hanusia_phi.AAC.4
MTASRRLSSCGTAALREISTSGARPRWRRANGCLPSAAVSTLLPLLMPPVIDVCDDPMARGEGGGGGGGGFGWGNCGGVTMMVKINNHVGCECFYVSLYSMSVDK